MPVIGRFASADRLIAERGRTVDDVNTDETPQKGNLYSYVLNNPLRYTDPTGYEEQEFAGKWLFDMAKTQLQLALESQNHNQIDSALMASSTVLQYSQQNRFEIFDQLKEGTELRAGGVEELDFESFSSEAGAAAKELGELQGKVINRYASFSFVSLLKAGLWSQQLGQDIRDEKLTALTNLFVGRVAEIATNLSRDEKTLFEKEGLTPPEPQKSNLDRMFDITK